MLLLEASSASSLATGAFGKAAVTSVAFGVQRCTSDVARRSRRGRWLLPASASRSLTTPCHCPVEGHVRLAGQGGLRCGPARQDWVDHARVPPDLFRSQPTVSPPWPLTRGTQPWR